ncbi:2'-5' RNA ligase family protein [Nocardia sp. GCM10030253]|uniref:2'-5' RNA ligase family protein n=1 Tax=Nocardia sp. GCM10030253 TaxID=3273404 RepID=UPI0036273D1F
MTRNTTRPRLQPRRGQVGPLGHYWFLIFEHAPDLHALTKSCQQTIDTAYFDLTPMDGLHLTLDRIAHDGASTPEQLKLIATAARRTCQDLATFTMTMERITNLRGAIGFIASPEKHVHTLRDALRAATLSVLPDAPVKDSSSLPHVTIAYPMYEGLAAKAAATVERIDPTSGGVEVTVVEAVMVALERREFSYSWDVAVRIPLAR